MLADGTSGLEGVLVTETKESTMSTTQQVFFRNKK